LRCALATHLVATHGEPRSRIAISHRPPTRGTPPAAATINNTRIMLT
jgi:hypothetical protein